MTNYNNILQKLGNTKNVRVDSRRRLYLNSVTDINENFKTVMASVNAKATAFKTSAQAILSQVSVYDRTIQGIQKNTQELERVQTDLARIQVELSAYGLEMPTSEVDIPRLISENARMTVTIEEKIIKITSMAEQGIQLGNLLL